MHAPLVVEVWSDVVCPWCFVGKRRFESALDQFRAVAGPEAGHRVEVVYRPYQLDPTAAPGVATPVAVVYAKKFGGPAEAERIFRHLSELGSAEGIDFRFDRALRANTLLAHQALWMAEHDGGVDQSAVKEQLLRAYFTEGLHLGDPEVVVACAARGGMDADRVRAGLEAGEGRAEVTELLALAASQGITAVPTYVFDGKWAVPGAQDPETFLRVLQRLSNRSTDG